MSVPTTFARTREVTFTFGLKPNPTTESEEKVMDKIPAALQHKIDYINALDISDKSKVSRITIAALDYQSYCRARSDGDKNMPYFKGTAFENLATLLDKHDEGCAKKWEEFDNKGLQPAKNPPPMPPTMPPKRVICEDAKFKREQPSGWYLAGCFLCVFILSASLGVILERSL